MNLQRRNPAHPPVVRIGSVAIGVIVQTHNKQEFVTILIIVE